MLYLVAAETQPIFFRGGSLFEPPVEFFSVIVFGYGLKDVTVPELVLNAVLVNWFISHKLHELKQIFLNAFRDNLSALVGYLRYIQPDLFTQWDTRADLSNR
ncbi:hypothetical protein [uncultured Desulfobulbus sp.]|uniref:hypothetical protein n=1 Tax=uncultured Desulfobulbus sp. TaxID=239745 RepID=UPI0029C877D2|nr:hypothetical protein [uncultured Desulfobulbus sp.]